MTLFLQLRIVITEAEHGSEPFDPLRIGLPPLAKRLLQSGNVVHLAIGRRLGVGRYRLHANHEGVAVCINEAGQHRAPLQVDEFGALSLVLHHLVRRANRDDLAVLFRNSLCARLKVVHGQDRTAGPDPIGDPFGGESWQRAEPGEQHRQERLGHTLHNHLQLPPRPVRPGSAP